MIFDELAQPSPAWPGKAFKRFWVRMFPVCTHCKGCSKQLEEPSRIRRFCGTCDAW
jgi:hypothetical protein